MVLALLQNIEKTLVLLNTKVDFALETLNVLAKKSSTQELLTVQRVNEHLEIIFYLLPLDNLETLEKIENWLKEDLNNIHDLVSYSLLLYFLTSFNNDFF